MALALGLLVPLAGCFGAYEADSLLVDGTGHPHDRGRRLGCLDVRVQVIRDSAVPPSWPVVGLDLGNRCRTPIHVDLRHVGVVARYEGPGRSVRLPAFDPRAEIDAAVLDGRAQAREVIAYVGPDETDERPRSVCVDVAGITAAEPTPPVCFEEGT